LPVSFPVQIIYRIVSYRIVSSVPEDVPKISCK